MPRFTMRQLQEINDTNCPRPAAAVIRLFFMARRYGDCVGSVPAVPRQYQGPRAANAMPYISVAAHIRRDPTPSTRCCRRYRYLLPPSCPICRSDQRHHALGNTRGGITFPPSSSSRTKAKRLQGREICVDSSTPTKSSKFPHRSCSLFTHYKIKSDYRPGYDHAKNSGTGSVPVQTAHHQPWRMQTCPQKILASLAARYGIRLWKRKSQGGRTKAHISKTLAICRAPIAAETAATEGALASALVTTLPEDEMETSPGSITNRAKNTATATVRFRP